jgi:hypothetical protein
MMMWLMMMLVRDIVRDILLVSEESLTSHPVADESYLQSQAWQDVHLDSWYCINSCSSADLPFMSPMGRIPNFLECELGPRTCSPW